MAKKTTTTKQAPKRARSAAKTKRKPPVKRGKPFRPEDHPNYQADLPDGFLQNTNPNQNQTF